jgi:GrpB-like predicted nucleotidyltransferase (UPF0157 family)
VAREYEGLKRALAPQFSSSTMQSYADAKGDLIERVVAHALSEGYPHGL